MTETQNETSTADSGGSAAVLCSAFHSGCDGCQWRSAEAGIWCEMFETSPSHLPCAQHDKFETEREITRLLLKKAPGLLELMMLEADMARQNDKLRDAAQ